DVVAVQAIGGLGHLGVQFAAKAGYRTVAISRGDDSRELALKLGAVEYIDSTKTDAAARRREVGGAKGILATAPSGKAIASVIDGLDANGVLMVIGAGPDPIQVHAAQLINPMRTIRGWASGTAADSEDTLRFCAQTGERAMIEKV